MLGFGKQDLVFYDGDCRLCHWLVIFLGTNDRKGKFRLVELQSEEGRRYAKQYGFTIAQEPESVILIQQNKVYQRSEAVLRILCKLGGGYAALFCPLIFLPGGFRDRLYDWIARNRYRLWGRRIACPRPIPPEGEST